MPYGKKINVQVVTETCPLFAHLYILFTSSQRFLFRFAVLEIQEYP